MLVPLAGCNKESTFEQTPQTGPVETGTISIELCGDDIEQTKALSAYTETREYEAKINSVQLLIFNQSGDIVKDARFTSTFTAMQATVPVGTYDVYAIVNRNLEDVYHVDEFSSIDGYLSCLSDNSVTGKNFVMSGQTKCTVNANTTSSCSISVKRLVGRVALSEINIATPSGYTVDIMYAFLSNVSGESYIDGTPISGSVYEDEYKAPTWYNYDGYDNLSVDAFDDMLIDTDRSIITDAENAQLPELTSYCIEAFGYENGNTWARDDGIMSHVLFYGCPNNSNTNPNGKHTRFETQKTCLVVCAEVYTGFGGGGVQYYTVPLDSFEANKTYTISLTITGFGSNDPNKPVQKGNMTASVSVSGWSAGDILEKTI